MLVGEARITIASNDGCFVLIPLRQENQRFYRNSYIAKVLSNIACELDGFKKSAIVHGDLAVHQKMRRQLLILQLHT